MGFSLFLHVVAKNTGLFKKEKRTSKSKSAKTDAKEDKKKVNSLEEKVANYIDEHNEIFKEDVTLIFVEEEVDKNSLYKVIEKYGEVTNFELLKMPQLIDNIRKICNAYKVNIDENTAKYLVECCGSGMQELINELRKVIEYAGAGGTITKESIDKLCIKQIQAIIFDLTDYLGARNVGKALEILKKLEYNKEPVQKILITLYNHLKKIYLTMLADEYRVNISETLNLKPNQMFLTTKYKMQAGYFKKEELRNIVQKLIDKINELTRENLTGIRVVRAFNAEKYQEDKFEEANKKLTNQQLFNQKTFAILQPVMYLVLYYLTLAIYFVGTFLIDNALMVDKIALFGDMVVFTSYGMQIIMSFLMLAMIFMMLPRAQVSANRINEVLDSEISIKDGKMKEDITKEKGTVEFKNVSFKYPDADEYLLKNISFKANKGETVAFIGSTGSGKSTLINLIPRFYDATEGEVLVDGINVKEYSQELLHNKIGYIPQKAVMFNGTVSSNVSYGENGKGEISEEKIEQAIDIAQGKDFVEKMEDKYNTHIAQGGTNISGGQKQRVAIARAIARDPEILIFDDSFSALDYKTDAALRKALKKHIKDTTNLIVAQRIGTIMNADKILVLNEGKVVGQGTHKELLNNCEIYKQIALSQLSKEELENE